jgi:hypothetical protein
LLCTIVNTLKNKTSPHFITETPPRSPTYLHKPFSCRLVDDFTSPLHLFYPIKYITKQKHYETCIKSSFVAPLTFEQEFDDNNYVNLKKQAYCNSNLLNDNYFSSSDLQSTSHTFHPPYYPMTNGSNNVNHDFNTILHINSNSTSLPIYSYMEMDPTSFENFNVSMLFPQAPKFIYEEDSENNLISF